MMLPMRCAVPVLGRDDPIRVIQSPISMSAMFMNLWPAYSWLLNVGSA
jgi:hypothetical protein